MLCQDGYGRTKLLQVVGAIVAARKHPELRVVVRNFVLWRFSSCLIVLQSVHPGSCTSDMAMSGPQATYEGMFPLPLPFIGEH
jgi:hypothetical protein